MGRVFVVQEVKGKDISSASRFGDLVVLMRGKYDRQIIGDTTSVTRSMQKDLEDYKNTDYILPIGDPVGIGIAVALAAANNNGQVSMLKWDKRDGQYNPVVFKLDVLQRGYCDGCE